MSARPTTVFFYGLFMDAEALRANGFHPIDARQACVVEWLSRSASAPR